MRRLPGPAVSRLSEGDRTPEALYELFRDWQRTQTQSSVTAPRSLRQQMDVWFCRAQEPMPGGIRCALSILEVMTCTLSRACPGHPCLRLTDDLHGCRQYGSNPAQAHPGARGNRCPWCQSGVKETHSEKAITVCKRCVAFRKSSLPSAPP